MLTLVPVVVDLTIWFGNQELCAKNRNAAAHECCESGPDDRGIKKSGQTGFGRKKGLWFGLQSLGEF